MREIRLYGSEGGEAKTFPTPIRKPSVVAKNIGNFCIIFRCDCPDIPTVYGSILSVIMKV
ncbi:hypothetical protein ASN18_3335 [Candidatus Magnetominusculus xianensis]|uniref:Uncharacterized protein n=1 Tax=Candidatus Magnetominusculus xianensis TaxID=1748249 RepID=A0ABR5SC77_9BACT|nr:hypothetical protein ASN18_3335 [Candidatus Magnetominusculus xianensis]